MAEIKVGGSAVVGGLNPTQHATESNRKDGVSEPLGIALVGCGTVGSGVARLLLEQPERLTARAGRPLQLRRILVRDPGKARGIGLPRELLTTDLRKITSDAGIDVAVELVGGVGWAKQAVLDLL